MKEQLITLTGQDLSTANGDDTRRELRAQKYLLKEVEALYKKVDKLAEKNQTQGWDDKAQLVENYVNALHGFVAQLEKMGNMRMSEPKGRVYDNYIANTRRKRERALRDNRDHADRDAKRRLLKQINSEGITTLAWDLDKFKLIARDRGYQTDEAIIYAIGEEVGLSRIKAKTLFETGRFTWGQVMCLGAMFEMTPKEFCDTFLSGYFVEMYGEFRASYENVDKSQLTKLPVMEKSIRSEEEKRMKEKKQREQEREKAEKERLIEYLASQDGLEIVEVNADGSPVGEEWWDD